MTILPAVVRKVRSAVARAAERRADARSCHARTVAGVMAVAATAAACAAPAPASGTGVAPAVPARHRAIEVFLPANARRGVTPAGRLDAVACAGGGWYAGGGS